MEISTCYDFLYFRLLELKNEARDFFLISTYSSSSSNQATDYGV